MSTAVAHKTFEQEAAAVVAEVFTSAALSDEQRATINSNIRSICATRGEHSRDALHRAAWAMRRTMS